MKDKLARYFGKTVELNAHGILYRGHLVGADEDFVYLKATTSWITLPMEAVRGIREAGRPGEKWILKIIEGEAEPDPDRSLEKKRYSSSDLDKIHQPEDDGEWPGANEEDTS